MAKELDDRTVRRDREGPRGKFHARVIAFVVVPVLLLGVCYFLFIEYVAVGKGGALRDTMVALRIGGLLLIALAVISALASGYLLADRVARPIRLLLRFSETGELPAGAGLFVHHRDWEVFLLYRRIHALVQQNRAGAGALDELESLKASYEELRAALARTGQNGVVAPVRISTGPFSEIAALLEEHRNRLLDFFRDLKGRAEDLRAELDRLEAEREAPSGAGDGNRIATLARNGEAGGFVPVEETAQERMTSLVAELRRIGTVIALEIERLGTDEVGEVGALYRRFQSGIDQVERLARCEPADPPDRRHFDVELWRRLREDLGSLERRLEEVEER